MFTNIITCPTLSGTLPKYRYTSMSVIHLVSSIFNSQLFQFKKKNIYKTQLLCHQGGKTSLIKSFVGHVHGLWVTQRGQVMRDSATLVFSAQLSHTLTPGGCVMGCSGAHRCSISLPGHSTEEAGEDTHRQPHTFLRTRNRSCTCTGREDLVQECQTQRHSGDKISNLDKVVCQHWYLLNKSFSR